MRIELIIIIVVVVLLVLYVISTYNSLTRAKNKARTNWAQIDVVLKRRADLIPNLVEIVKEMCIRDSINTSTKTRS